MLGSHFYHGTIRKLVIYFGSIFNDIYIDRVDASGEVQRTIKVPLQYGPKERYLTRYIQNPDLLREVSMVFPRISFEMTSVAYDPTRKLNSVGRISSPSSYSDQLGNVYNPVPYNFEFTMSIISRNTEDGLRIVEQILPFFTPQWTETLNLVPDANVSMDVPIILNSVNNVDTYENNFEAKEWVIWELKFTLKAYLYGPAKRQSIIKRSNVNLNSTPSGDIDSFIDTFDPATVHIEVTPGLTANGEPTSNAANSIPASEIKATDNYGFITDITENI